MAIKFVLFCFFFALLLPLQALRISRQSFLSGNTTSVQREMIDFETQRDYLQVLLVIERLYLYLYIFFFFPFFHLDYI